MILTFKYEQKNWGILWYISELQEGLLLQSGEALAREKMLQRPGSHSTCQAVTPLLHRSRSQAYLEQCTELKLVTPQVSQYYDLVHRWWQQAR
jgi:hypothetical protein